MPCKNVVSMATQIIQPRKLQKQKSILSPPPCPPGASRTHLHRKFIFCNPPCTASVPPLAVYKMHPLNPLIPNAAVYPWKQWANKSVFSRLFSSGSVTPKYLLAAAAPPPFTCSTMRANNGPKWQPRLILYVAIMRGQAFLAIYWGCH